MVESQSPLAVTTELVVCMISYYKIKPGKKLSFQRNILLLLIRNLLPFGSFCAYGFDGFEDFFAQPSPSHKKTFLGCKLGLAVSR